MRLASTAIYVYSNYEVELEVTEVYIYIACKVRYVQ